MVWWPLLVLVVGFALLIWGAGRFIEGAAAIARGLGLPPILVGTVVVGFGTSAPEVMISLQAAMQGNAGIALGNAIGSNITNIGLILGLSALVTPIVMHSRVLRRELPMLMLVTAFAALLLRDGRLSRLEALGLLLAFVLLMAWIVITALRSRRDALARQVEREYDEPVMPVGRASWVLATGLGVLLLGSRLAVRGAVDIAQAVGVSDLYIGLTIIALGTSLPELVTSVLASWKREDEIALGNVLGSNAFNTLAVIGIAGAIQPMSLAPEMLTRDLPAMVLVTLALVVMGVGGARLGQITRVGGALLLVFYLGYNALLFASLLGS